MTYSKELMTLLTLSKEMLAASEQGDWVLVAELDQQRAPLIQRFFADHDLRTASPDARANLEALISLNQAIQSKGELERQDLLEQLGSIKRIHKIEDAYAID